MIRPVRLIETEVREEDVWLKIPFRLFPTAKCSPMAWSRILAVNAGRVLPASRQNSVVGFLQIYRSGGMAVSSGVASTRAMLGYEAMGVRKDLASKIFIHLRRHCIGPVPQGSSSRRCIKVAK